MDKYSKIEHLSDKEFRRLTGVKRETFLLMVSVYKQELKKSYKRIGRPSKLSAEDKVLMMLEYNREYRTYFHISKDYGIAEGNAYKCIKQVENLLIQSGKFSLPKRTSLIGEQVSYEVLVIDATESKVERPKKNKSVITVEKNTITI